MANVASKFYEHERVFIVDDGYHAYYGGRLAIKGIKRSEGEMGIMKGWMPWWEFDYILAIVSDITYSRRLDDIDGPRRKTRAARTSGPALV